MSGVVLLFLFMGVGWFLFLPGSLRTVIRYIDRPFMAVLTAAQPIREGITFSLSVSNEGCYIRWIFPPTLTPFGKSILMHRYPFNYSKCIHSPVRVLPRYVIIYPFCWREDVQ